MQLSRNDLFAIYSSRLVLLLILAAILLFGCDAVRNSNDPPVVAIGRTYSAVISASYSSAWSQAAADVEAGKPIAEAIASVRPAWEAARLKAFEATVSPVFEAIVPAGTPDADVAPDRRTALVKAFREFARGVGP